jgi:hypothetical protein
MADSELLTKQKQFSKMLGLLIHWAYEHGYELTFQPEHEKHIKNSLHYIGLAKDLNLFVNGKYMKDTESYRAMGEFWESIGGDWGGRFGDGNHFSIRHNGVK